MRVYSTRGPDLLLSEVGVHPVDFLLPPGLGFLQHTEDKDDEDHQSEDDEPDEEA